MSSPAIAYRVEDRSLLLPAYRKYFVDPILPYLPRSLHPNTITHAGHLANLIGTAILVALWPQRGLAFAFAALTLQFYLWCDNGDGAHARRTNQCSAYGELLDHGLDQFNTVYIGYLTAMGLGVSPVWWVVLALIIPGAACITYWEQSTTGVFRLGLLNQVESLLLLSTVLLVDAIYGPQIFERIAFHGVTLRLAFLLWSSSTILFGMARSIARVLAHGGVRVVMPIAPLLFFGGSIFAAALVGAVTTVEAVTLATCLNVAFGMRMLAQRLKQREPQAPRVTMYAGAALAVLTAWKTTGHELSDQTGVALALLACVVFGLETARSARASAQHLATIEPAR